MSAVDAALLGVGLRFGLGLDAVDAALRRARRRRTRPSGWRGQRREARQHRPPSPALARRSAVVIRRRRARYRPAAGTRHSDVGRAPAPARREPMADAPDEVLEVDEARRKRRTPGRNATRPQEGDDERETNDSEEPSGGCAGAQRARDDDRPCNSFSNLMSDPLYNEYDRHCRRATRSRAGAKMQFKVNDASELLEDVDASAAADADAGLGVWQHGDEYQGDVNLRTLKTLLERIDQRGFERSAHQLEFHEAFSNACSRVIYKADGSFLPRSCARTTGSRSSPRS